MKKMVPGISNLKFFIKSRNIDSVFPKFVKLLDNIWQL